MAQQAILRTTEISEDEEEETGFPPLTVSVPSTQELPIKKKTISMNRRSSLDEDNISSRRCFGVDAETLLAHLRQEEEEEEEDNVSTYENPCLNYYKRTSVDGVPQSSGHQSKITTFKKRRVTVASEDSSQFTRKVSNDASYFRRVTQVGHEAQCSRLASQFSVPGSQFTVSQTGISQVAESFLRAVDRTFVVCRYVVHSVDTVSSHISRLDTTS